jgi:hypothetical protein
VFATTVTRDAAFGGAGEKTLAEGQFAYIEATDVTQYYNGTSWLALGGKLGQVVSTNKTDTFSSSSTSYVDITGMSVSITPSAATSKILVVANLMIGSTATDPITQINLVRGSTSIAQGDAAGSRTRAATGVRVDISANCLSLGINFLDSPATTSSTTYKLQMLMNSGTSYLNRSNTDSDSAVFARYSSTITVMEILA